MTQPATSVIVVRTCSPGCTATRASAALSTPANLGWLTSRVNEPAGSRSSKPPAVSLSATSVASVGRMPPPRARSTAPATARPARSSTRPVTTPPRTTLRSTPSRSSRATTVAISASSGMPAVSADGSDGSRTRSGRPIDSTVSSRTNARYAPGATRIAYPPSRAVVVVFSPAAPRNTTSTPATPCCCPMSITRPVTVTSPSCAIAAGAPVERAAPCAASADPGAAPVARAPDPRGASLAASRA